MSNNMGLYPKSNASACMYVCLQYVRTVFLIMAAANATTLFFFLQKFRKKMVLYKVPF